MRATIRLALRGRSRRGWWLAVLLILWLATGLRFHHLEAQSFWNDEGNSARLSERSLDLIIAGTASDIHPPLYYLMLRGWREGLGATEFGLRALSAFAGVGVVAATTALGRQWGRREGLLAGLLTAVSPPLIYYSQETRMYSLLAFLAVLSSLCLWRWLAVGQPRTGRSRRLTLVGYILISAAGLYTHYFYPAILVLHNLLFLIWLGTDHRRQWRAILAQWVGAMLAIIILYLPWLPIFLRQAGGRPGSWQPLAAFVVDSGRWLFFGSTVDAATVRLPLLAGAVLILLGLRLGGRRGRVAALGLLLPVAFMAGASLMRPAYFKFMVVAVPALALLVAAGWRPRFRWLLLPLLLLVLWGQGIALANLYQNPQFARADYRAIAARISNEGHPSAAVLLNAANQWEVFTYYYEDESAVYPIPRGGPDPAQIDQELDRLTAEYDRLYAIFWGEAERDPNRLVERWLDENAFKATDEWYGDVRLVTYAVPAEPATEMTTPVEAEFADQIQLAGYTLRRRALLPGDILQVALFWQVDQPLTERYKVFLHLLNEEGQLVAQRDSEPGGGLALTTTWEAGVLVRDNHGILVPFDTPPGRYTLRLGLYPLDDPGHRLPVETESGVFDSYSLGEIRIGEE